MQREDHLQCSAKNRPWGGSGKQPDMEKWQGGRRSVGFSSLAWSHFLWSLVTGRDRASVGSTWLRLVR